MKTESFEKEFESKHVWDFIDCYFKNNHGLQSQAIASFNRCVKDTLPNIILSCGKVSVDDRRDQFNQTVHSIELTKVHIEDQVLHRSADGRIYPLFPHESRGRNLTYSSYLFVDVHHTIQSVDIANYGKVIKESFFEKVLIAEIPIMVKSKFCNLYGMSDTQLASYHEDPMDPGGYFIINGKEKVIVTQEKPASNKLFLFKPMCDSLYQYECEIRSAVDCTTDRIFALWIHIPGNPKSESTFKDAINQISSYRYVGGSRRKNLISGINDESIKNKARQKFYKSRPGLVVTIASLRQKIPLLVLFKALGYENDKEVQQTLLASPQDLDFYEALRTTMENSEARQIKGEEDALYYIGNKQSSLSRILPPLVGLDNICMVKADSRNFVSVWLRHDEYSFVCLGCRSIKDYRRTDEIIAHGRKVVNEEVLPALGSKKIYDPIKGIHIGYMVNRLIFAYLGRIQCDDRDHLENKRFDLAGPMLAALFKAQLNNLMNEAKFALTRRINMGVSYDVVKNIIKHNLITRGINHAMSTGNWGDQRRGSPGRDGVSQLLNRLTTMATLSYLRRINSPTKRLVRMIAPRQIHTTAFGYVCPADTPEGETVGLLKSLSVMAEVSTDFEKGRIIAYLEALDYYYSIEDHPEKLAENVLISINSEIVGSCSSSEVARLMTTLRTYRWKFDKNEDDAQKLINSPVVQCTGISNQVSISYDPQQREVRIRSDSGRPFRPLLVVKNNQLVLRQKHLQRLLNPDDVYNWKDLVRDGVIEYLDAAESESAMVAMFPSDLKEQLKNSSYISNDYRKPLSYKVTYTHCEIHPSMILGVCASLIPYPDHNQSPRNTYQSGMTKQAIGVYQTNFHYRCDTEAHVLHYPQVPLVTTKTAKFIQYDESPAGINAITAICCYTGYNQEDSLIVCKSSVQRGLFRSTLYKTKTDEARRNNDKGDIDETFELPRKGEVMQFRSSDYTGLDTDGFPEPGLTISDEEPLIGKTKFLGMLPGDSNNIGRATACKIDVSTIFRSSIHSQTSVIDSVMLTSNPEGYRLVRVKTRTPRNAQIGDKFASRHGQKGVVGMDYDETDMPFTKNGIVPDIILNPHAIPSRMTIGHLIETVAAKNAALTGTKSDGTCFTKRLTVEEIGEELKKLGHHKYGMEVMYNGTTGRKMASQIFIGPVFYQRLKHMAEDKINVRSRGPLTQLCKQPIAGMQRQGGLRFGEMERDSTISHGAASFLRERLFIVSDYHTFKICNKCGNFLANNMSGRVDCHLLCLSCNSVNEGVTTIELPYASKLLFQELRSMNIRVQLKPNMDNEKPATKMLKNKAESRSESGLIAVIMDKMLKDVKIEDSKKLPNVEEV